METKRNFVGLRSFKKSELTPFKDVKDDVACSQSTALANALMRKQIAPLLACSIKGREGVYILDGVQRWKLSNANDYLRCYYIGELEEELAFEYWFMTDISVEKNIVKIMQVIIDLTPEQVARFSKVSKYTTADFAHFVAMGNFNWEKYLKEAKVEDAIQPSLFD